MFKQRLTLKMNALSGLKPSAVCLLIIIVTAVLYWPVMSFDFVNYDDDLYIYKNPRMVDGLSVENVRWAFTAVLHGNWFPLTWLSYLADAEIAGLSPGQYHQTNLLLHLVNVMLLFLFLFLTTRCMWRSAFVAALFAVHPLHVESVAWIAERKDVLSTFFWLLSMLAYVLYVERPGVVRYMPVAVFFVFGLMSKPMVVSLPLMLLVLDFWPLGRLQKVKQDSTSRSVFWLILEKLPLLVITVVGCIITLIAQSRGGAVNTLEAYSLGVRSANAGVAYIAYLAKTFWPVNLALLYPHPEDTLAIWKVVSSGVLLFLISAATFRLRCARPYLAAGFVWYVITLVPVIGLVQVGIQAMADRYTYIPLIGIFVIFAWGIPDLLRHLPYYGMMRRVAAISAVVIIVVLVISARMQVSYWRDDITAFSHAVQVTSNNSVAHFNLANALHREGDYRSAIEHFKETVRIDPTKAQAYHNMGVVYLKERELDAGIYNIKKSLEIRPNCDYAHRNLAMALWQKGRLREALIHLKEAQRLNPKDPMTRQMIERIKS